MDTDNLLNYGMNNVMIFIKGGETKKILIRSNRESYFSKSILETRKLTLEEEISKDRSYKMGWYVEFTYEDGNFTDADSLLRDLKYRRAVLDIFFDGFRNIFLPKSILMDNNGQITSVNPFGKGDEYIIREKDYVKRDDLKTIFRAYYNIPLFVSARYFFNRVFIGTFISLMIIDEQYASEILEFDYNDDDFYQNQMINKWVIKQNYDSEMLFKLFGEWYEQLEYCIYRDKKESSNGASNIADYEIKSQGFFPFYIDYQRALSFLAEEYLYNNTVLYLGMVAVNEVGKSITIQYNGLASVLAWDSIVDRADVMCTLLNGSRCYVIENNGRYYLDNQKLCAQIYNLKNIWANCMTYDTACKITGFLYEDLLKGMKLHYAGLSEAAESIFDKSFFEDQAYYRILHNMLRYNVTADKTETYFKIFMGHELMNFSDIMNDDTFLMSDINTLYIPKNSLKAESVLVDIYNEYIRSRAKRNEDGLYSGEVEFSEKEGKYHKQGQIIKRVVLLSDNFERGSQTINVLKAYLGIDNDEKRVIGEKGRIHHVSCGNERISLEELRKTNGCRIDVHAYYGTDEGKKKIEEFMSNNGIMGEVSYFKPISKTVSSIYKEASCIFGKINANKNAYAVIREFNMTKCNVFPDEMMENPKKAITLFIKKEEIKKRDEDAGIIVNDSPKTLDEGLKELVYYFEKNGFNDRSLESASILTVFSVLPPSMRIRVLEDLLNTDHNPVVLEKLAKAYAKAGRVNEMGERLNNWIELGYINERYAIMLSKSANALYRYRDNLPIATNIDLARKNFENVLSVARAPEQFLEIMRTILYANR